MLVYQTIAINSSNAPCGAEDIRAYSSEPPAPLGKDALGQNDRPDYRALVAHLYGLAAPGATPPGRTTQRGALSVRVNTGPAVDVGVVLPLSFVYDVVVAVVDRARSALHRLLVVHKDRGNGHLRGRGNQRYDLRRVLINWLRGCGRDRNREDGGNGARHLGDGAVLELHVCLLGRDI
jgi:hypothetical protein